MRVINSQKHASWFRDYKISLLLSVVACCSFALELRLHDELFLFDGETEEPRRLSTMRPVSVFDLEIRSLSYRVYQWGKHRMRGLCLLSGNNGEFHSSSLLTKSIECHRPQETCSPGVALDGISLRDLLSADPM